MRVGFMRNSIEGSAAPRNLMACQKMRIMYIMSNMQIRGMTLAKSCAHEKLYRTRGADFPGPLAWRAIAALSGIALRTVSGWRPTDVRPPGSEATLHLACARQPLPREIRPELREPGATLCAP